MQIFTNHKKGENQIMKKQIKWTAALSTAAIMTALIPGVCVPAMAAETTGWIQLMEPGCSMTQTGMPSPIPGRSRTATGTTLTRTAC